MGLFWSDRAKASFIEALPVSGDVAEDTEFPELAEIVSALREVQDYATAQHSDVIRAAMSSPSDAAKLDKALEAMEPSTQTIVGWYELAEKLSKRIPRLLSQIDEAAIKHATADHNSSVQALASMLSFLLHFDSAKSVTPSIQNDFSFVKRSLAKPYARHLLDPNVASAVSMFIAQSSPMIARVAIAIDAPQARVLALITSLCCAALGDKRLPSSKVDGCLATMTSAFILFDRSHKAPGTRRACRVVLITSVFAGGAFATSLVSARKVANAIRKHANEPTRLDLLIGAYRYSTLNYASSASSSVRSVVER